MNKFKYVITSLLLVTLLFSAASVLASPAPSVVVQGKPTRVPGGKPTKVPGGKPEKTPGAKATEQANKPKGNQDKGGKGVYKGSVAAVSDASLTLTQKDGTSLTFVVTGDTRLQFNGPRKGGTLADIQIGSGALVQAVKGEDGSLTATRILAQGKPDKPGKPQKAHRVGLVTEYTPGASITVQGKDGDTTTFGVIASTKILPHDHATELAVGSRVTIIAPRDPKNGELIALGIVLHIEDDDDDQGTPEVEETEQPEGTEEPAEVLVTATPAPN